MRALALGLVLAASGALAQGGPAGIDNVGEWRALSETDPAKAVSAGGDGWLALTLPAQPGTRSPCCWSGRWDRASSRGCTLGDHQGNYGNSQDSPIVSELKLFARVGDSAVDRLLLAGPDCPVDAAGQDITTLEEASVAETQDWLAALARAGSEEMSHQAIYALSQSRGDAVNQHLLVLAREPGEWPARDAVFWLGEARGEAGARVLYRLLDELTPGEIRRAINFALAQNGSDAALDRLERVALEDRDPEQRADALFWLAQSHPQRAKPLLRQVLDQAPDGDALERAVFAVSQLSDGSGDALLFEIAGDPARPDALRKKALFWLAQSDDETTIDRLVALLTDAS
jgi:hypothetical protein